MLIKALGVFDILAALAILLDALDRANSWFPRNIILAVGILLLVKGLFFLIFGDFATIFDIICAVIILISLAVSMPLILMIIIGVFLLQKGIISVVS